MDQRIKEYLHGKDIQEALMFLGGCNSLTSVNYLGTKEDWDGIKKDRLWNISGWIVSIHCTDGDIRV